MVPRDELTLEIEPLQQELSPPVSTVDRVSEYIHRRGIEVRIEGASRGWHLLSEVEQAVQGISTSRGWRAEFFGFLLHEYGELAEYRASHDASVGELWAHVCGYAMRAYDANAYWSFDRLDTCDTATSISACLRIGSESEDSLKEVEVSVSGPDVGTVMATFNSLWRVIEAARTSEIGPVGTGTPGGT